MTPVYLTELLTVYKPTHQLCFSSDTSTVCLPSVCTHLLGQRSFFQLHHLFRIVSLSKFDHQTNPHLLNLPSSSYPVASLFVCVLCVQVYVCVRAWGSLFRLCFVLCFVMGYVFQFGEVAHKRVHYYNIPVLLKGTRIDLNTRNKGLGEPVRRYNIIWKGMWESTDTVSPFGLAVRRLAGKQKDLGSILLSLP